MWPICISKAHGFFSASHCTLGTKQRFLVEIIIWLVLALGVTEFHGNLCLQMCNILPNGRERALPANIMLTFNSAASSVVLQSDCSVLFLCAGLASGSRCKRKQQHAETSLPTVQ